MSKSKRKLEKKVQLMGIFLWGTNICGMLILDFLWNLILWTFDLGKNTAVLKIISALFFAFEKFCGNSILRFEAKSTKSAKFSWRKN